MYVPGCGSPFAGAHCQSGAPLFSRALHNPAFSTVTDADVMLVSGGFGRSSGAGVMSARLSSVTVGWGFSRWAGVVANVAGESLAPDMFSGRGRRSDVSVVPRLC